ncbi:methyltransferase type 12 [Arthrobacter pityocampae]|uniref:Methyltransferase type 12 n=1 Tax=Arthrobacter pityocampae TaxID=547334 RepID=A0A2S5IVJ3_9MICC|nr:class I SAM-dependent methyltransferase [Arthrobacter pityocampae]PPB48588.1 methyltransferase type 12 [Arthrobacter pityocampae]
MLRIVRQLLMVPEVARLARHTPRDPAAAWEGYWSDVRATGTRGEVLWDADIGPEAEQYTPAMDSSMDFSLPVLDVGCGNGQWTRWLALRFPAAVGVDVAESAVRRARQETDAGQAVSFRALDLTESRAGDMLYEEYGEMNVFVRGVFHVLRPPQRRQLAQSLHTVTGRRGRVLLTETNYRGTPLSYMQSLGATPGSIPHPLRKAIGGIPVPGQFGARERRAAFPEAQWQLLADGPVTIEAVPMSGDRTTAIPGYFATMGTR